MIWLFVEIAIEDDLLELDKGSQKGSRKQKH
jgi:hypothetical protein